MVDLFQGKGECVHEDMLITFEMPGGVAEKLGNNLIMPKFVSYQNLTVASRGDYNTQCDEIESDFKSNTHIPRLIEKAVTKLYGAGLNIYKPKFENGEVKRDWLEMPSDIIACLDVWEDLGSDCDYKEAAKMIARRMYTFEDYFIRWRFYKGAKIGAMPVAFFEVLENKRCRLASDKPVTQMSDYEYKDFNFVVVGNWCNGIEAKKVYPKFLYKNVGQYYAAVSHHVIESVGDVYGNNKVHTGGKEWIKGMNQTANYLNSYRENSFAAKVHVIIPNEWYESVDTKIKAICQENKNRAAAEKSMLKYRGFEVGTEYSVAIMNRVVKQEIENLSSFLSGAKNQGKLYATFSYRTKDGTNVEWKIEPIDLKSKEYVESQKEYHKLGESVVLTSIGMDPSISNVTNEGMISKSGSDTYYNNLVYLADLDAVEDTMLEPFNMLLRLNFPKYWNAGLRFGCYRNIPKQQQNTTQSQRLQNNVQ